MGLVNVKVELVSLLQSNEAGQVAKSALHTVKTFHGDQNLPPRAMCAWLTLADALAEETLKVVHVVVLEHINDSTRDTSTETDRGVIELIADHQATLADQSREHGGIGDETHAVDGGSFLAHEFSDLLLHVNVQVAGARVSTRRAV